MSNQHSSYSGNTERMNEILNDETIDRQNMVHICSAVYHL